MDRLAKKMDEAVEQEVELEQANKVPDAPFKKNWHELAFKRALTEAVNDPTIERLTWTTGAVQADRYNLAKYINKIEAIPAPSPMTEGRTVYDLAVQYKEGEVKNLRAVPPESLADYVGKEMADKIINDADTVPSQRFYLTNKNAPIDPLGEQRIDPSTGFATKEEGLRYLENNNMAGDFEIREGVVKEGGVKTYSGLDLEVGGEFHKQLYDGKTVRFAKKFLKKYGVEPKKARENLPLSGYEIVDKSTPKAPATPRGQPWFDVIHTESGQAVQKAFPSREEAHEWLLKSNFNPDVWYIDITPEMRFLIGKYGVPLTQRRKQMGLMAGYA